MTLEFVQTTTITFRHFVPENQYPTMTRFKGVALEMFGTWNSSDFVDFTEFFNAEWLRMTSFKAKSSKCTHFLFPNWRSLNPLQGHLTFPKHHLDITMKKKTAPTPSTTRNSTETSSVLENSCPGPRGDDLGKDHPS